MPRTEMDVSELEFRAYQGSGEKGPHVTITLTEGDTKIVARVPRAVFDDQNKRFAAELLDELKVNLVAEIKNDLDMVRGHVQDVNIAYTTLVNNIEKVLSQRVRRAKSEAKTESAEPIPVR